jgi:hypothetical protein
MRSFEYILGIVLPFLSAIELFDFYLFSELLFF